MPGNDAELERSKRNQLYCSAIEALLERAPALLQALDGAREIADRLDLVGDHVGDLEASELILDRDHQLEPIKPISPEVVAQAQLVLQPIGIDPKMSGDDRADLDGKTVMHGRSPSMRTNDAANHCTRRARLTAGNLARNAASDHGMGGGANCSLADIEAYRRNSSR
jgi:hypothetical protein